MSIFGRFLSFPAVLLPGMEQASIVRTDADAANALAALAGGIGLEPPDEPFALVSDAALRSSVWGGKYAGRESRFGLECGKELQQLVQSEITDVVTCGNSAAVSQGYALEMSAALEGWHLFNIFGLPYTLESSAAHTIAVAVSARGARLALSSGEGSGPASFQFVEGLLAEDPRRTIIWGVAEQFSEGTKAVLSAEGRKARSRCLDAPRLHFEGSILFAVTAMRTNVSAFEVIEVRDLHSSDELYNSLLAGASPKRGVKRVYYVNSAATHTPLPPHVSPQDVVNLHHQFGDGWSINSFVPFLHMLTRPCNGELIVILSDGQARWQLLRANRLADA